MRYDEILEVLKSNISRVSHFAMEDYTPEDLGLGPVDEVYQKGGEGQGDHWESVKYFKDHDVYIKVIGYYSSYNGVDFYGDWDCCLEVMPKEKTIIVYN